MSDAVETFHLPETVLRGREVTLRPLTLADVPALAAASGESREHYRYNPVPDGVEATEQYVQRALASKARGQRYPFAISFRDRIVGTTSYSDFQPWEWQVPSEHRRADRPNALEVGYTWLAASAQRTGCNTEAKFLLFEHAFDVWQVHSVCLRTDQRNQRSRNAIERLGATFEGIRRAHSPGADGTVRSSAFFSIVAAEWPSVREHLQRLMRRA
jgi:RimJ/RimL family protein N-acetyltransferase